MTPVQQRAGYTAIDSTALARLVPSAPPPRRAVKRAQQLSDFTVAAAQGLFALMGAAVAGAAVLGAAPVMALGALASSVQVDPIILAAVPASIDAPDDSLAGWFVLAQWSW
jgi:hypothetical protein